VVDRFKIEFEPVRGYEDRLAKAYAFLIQLAESSPEREDAND